MAVTTRRSAELIVESAVFIVREALRWVIEGLTREEQLLEDLLNFKPMLVKYFDSVSFNYLLKSIFELLILLNIELSSK